MKCTVFGYFADSSHYRNEEISYGVHKSNFFEGEIFVKDDGSFDGNLIDQFGDSLIRGKLDGKVMEFSKVYIDPTRNGSKGQITYSLCRSRLLQTNDIPLPGCWIGQFTRSEFSDAFKERFKDSPEELRHLNKDNKIPGYACLAMYELSD